MERLKGGVLKYSLGVQRFVASSGIVNLFVRVSYCETEGKRERERERDTRTTSENRDLYLFEREI